MKTGIPSVDEVLQGATHVIASDECGLGSFAGPLIIGVVCVPIDWIPPEGLTDSKKLSWEELVRLADNFRSAKGFQTAWATEPHSHEDIDRLGVGVLLPLAHEWAIRAMVETCTVVFKGKPACIVDGSMNVTGALSLPKADLLIPACSMASVLAKVDHDLIMADYDKEYPGYDLANNVGYNSTAHIVGLEKLGPSPIHRRSYASYDKYKLPEVPMNAWEDLE